MLVGQKEGFFKFSVLKIEKKNHFLRFVQKLSLAS